MKRGLRLFFAASFAAALAGLAPGVRAQSPDATRCLEEMRKASNACGQNNAPQINQCMSERAGTQCVMQFEAGKADAVCEQRVKDAIVPCAEKVRPALMQCLSERVGARCMEQSGVSGKAAK